MINSQNNGAYSYTRVGFVPAIKVGDSLVVLTNGFEKMEPAKLDTATIFKNYRDNKLTNFIVDLVGDKHKNVTWSFRYVNPDNAADVEAEGEANAFLIESNVYAHDYVNDVVDGKYTTVYGCEEHRIAPTSRAAWLKMQNGCLVLTDNSATFDNAKTNADGALVFNVEQMAEGDEFVTSNDEIAAEGIAIVAGNGSVTIQGAAGKSVVITNILGKVVAETVLTSDNVTIAVPAGIVAVAVDGQAPACGRVNTRVVRRIPGRQWRGVRGREWRSRLRRCHSSPAHDDGFSAPSVALCFSTQEFETVC